MSHWLDDLDRHLPRLRDIMRPQALQARERLRAGVRSLLLQAATGSGKTHTGSLLAMLANEFGGRVLIGVPRTKLCGQFSERLLKFDTPHSILASDKQFRGKYDPQLRVQVAMGPTLYARTKARKDGKPPKLAFPRAQLLLLDEAHLWGARTFTATIEEYRRQNAIIIGLTATPWRVDGMPLDQIFQEMIMGPSYEELLAAGALVPPVCYSTPTELDLNRLSVRGGDYDQHELSDAMSGTRLIGKLVEQYQRRLIGRKTLCFAVDTKHANKIMTALAEKGFKSVLVSHKNDETEVEAALGLLKSGEVQVVVSCTKLSYGVDEPFVDGIIMARPTKSIVLWLQAVGRGVRAFEGKTDCIVLDHGDCIANLGHPRDPFQWSLSAPPKKNGETIWKRCPDCHAQIAAGCTVCPECAAEMPRAPMPVTGTDHDLEEAIPVALMDPPRFASEARGWFCQEFASRAPKWKTFVLAVVISRYGKEAGDALELDAVTARTPSPAVCGLMLQRIQAFRAAQRRRSSP